MIQINQTERQAGPPGPIELVRLLMHDARTPLNAVRGFAELLLAGAGGPLSEAALGHLIEIAGASRAIEAALGLAQQLAEFDPAAMDHDAGEIDLALLLAETGFVLTSPRGNQIPRAFPVAASVWRPALALCRSHLVGGEQSKAAPPAAIIHQVRHTLDLTLRGADMPCDGASSVLAERLLVAMLGETGAVLRSSAPHRPIVIGLMQAVAGGVQADVEAGRQR